MKLTEESRKLLCNHAKDVLKWYHEDPSARGILNLLADLEEAEAGMNTLYDNSRIEIARLQDELATVRKQLAEAQAYAYEQNAALRCAITQLCDCGRYLPSYDYQHIAEKSTPQGVIDYYLSEATAPYKQALQAISSIENRDNCGDWDEIEEARAIADAALSAKEKSND